MIKKVVGESRRFLYLSLISAMVIALTAILTYRMTLLDTMTLWSWMRVLITIHVGIFLMNKILSIRALDQIKPVFIPLLNSCAE